MSCSLHRMTQTRCWKSSASCAELCKLFDTETCHGQDMAAYTALLDKTVAAIVAQFTRKNAANLLTGRGGKRMDATRAVKKPITTLS